MSPVFALLIAHSAVAATLRVEESVAPGETLRVDLLDSLGATLTHWLVTDGGGARQLGWRPDTAPEPGLVRAELSELWLPAGTYGLHIQGTTLDRTDPLVVHDDAPRMVSATLPEGATAVHATRWSPEQGTDGYAWAPDLGGVCFLPLGLGEWTVTAEGRPDVQARVRGDEDSRTLHFEGAPRAPKRVGSTAQQWLVRGLLVPMTMLIIGMLVWLGMRAWRTKDRRGIGLAVLVSAVFAAVPTLPFLMSPATLAPMPTADFRDPVTSASLAAAIANASVHLSDLATTWNWPEGHSWLALGPSWLSYLLVAPLSWAFGGLVAHNIGLFLWVAALGVGAWTLARSRGIARVPALLAAGFACLAPALTDELDKTSLDRAGLCLVPIFLLCLDRAVARGGIWIVASAAALGGTFLLQTYYGLYLSIACPLLVLPRVLGPNVLRRLGRVVAVGAVSLGVLLPGLVVLQQGTQGTVYAGDDQRLVDVVDDLWAPLPDKGRIEAFLNNNDPKLSGASEARVQRRMDSPEDRLLTAVAHSLPAKEALFPGSTLPGRSFWWVIAALALVVARKRRAAALSVWDVSVFLLMALGPVLRTGPTDIGTVLPYYAFHVWVPGFDQLKHPNRSALLAAAVAGVPAAAVLDGFFGHHRKARWLALPVVAVLVALSVSVHFRTRAEAAEEGLPYADLAWLSDNPKYQGLALHHAQSQGQRFELEPALAGLAGRPALVLPVLEPLPVPIFIALTQAKIPAVNGAPHGIPELSRLPPWVETDPFLNELAWRSGSDRARLWTGGPGTQSTGPVQAAGLELIILFRDHLSHPSLLAPTEALLDGVAERIRDTDSVVVWALPGPQ